MAWHITDFVVWHIMKNQYFEVERILFKVPEIFPEWDSANNLFYFIILQSSLST